MQRSTQKNGLINLLSLLVVGAAGYAVARYADSLAGQVVAVFMGLGVLVAAVSWFQMRLEENERLEKLELDELAKSKGSSTLFSGKDAEVFPAQRSREQFERYFVPAFTVLLFLVEVAGAYFIWRWLSHPETSPALRQPTMALALFGLFFLALFLLGKFSATIARIENHRLLRPGASWLLLSAYLCFFVTLGIVGVEFDFRRADLHVAYGLCALLGLVAVETAVNLVLEIYRPRVKGRPERPLYESRLVGLLGQPEGLITTAAQALDYQFGFKVSETWFYRFFERALGRLLLLQLGVLCLSTCFVVIESGEHGLLERFGRPVAGGATLEPGFHLKLPWPIDRVHRYRTEQIQTFNVGFTPDDDHDHETTVLWRVPHANEENFLVANSELISAEAVETVSGRRPPPVSLLTVSIPVHFQIDDLLAWAYHHEDSSNLLQSLATREVVRYLVSADLNEVMSRERAEAARVLRERIQAASDRHELGAKIVFVGLQDIHPPVPVAEAFEAVISASHQKQSNILAAQAFAITTNALAEAQATNLLNLASAARTEQTIGALSRAAMFTNQIPAYLAAPSVFQARAYLQMLPQATEGARKYVLLTTNTQDVITLDLQEKFSGSLLEDVGFQAPQSR